MCTKCNSKSKIVNHHYQLCLTCNNLRLKTSKEQKAVSIYKLPHLEKTSIKTKKKASKTKTSSTKVNQLKLDEQFYEECFNVSNHKCEECGQQLPDQFRSESGKINARWRYSHIIPKSIAPQLRHDINNINHLCLTCHSRWENGDKQNMNIFGENLTRFPNFLNRLNIR